MRPFTHMLAFTLAAISSVHSSPVPSDLTSFLTAREAATEIPPEGIESQVYKALEDQFRGSEATVSTLSIPLVKNDLEDGKCAPNILIHARGTIELGNIGLFAGVPLINELEKLRPGRFIYQGVNNYPALVSGYLIGGSPSGARNMADQVLRASRQCPGSRVFLSAYSQGAQVTHLASDLIPSSLYGIIGGIVVFGDPYNGKPFPGTLNNNVLTICNSGDLICDGIPLPLPPHLTYPLDAPRAAKYISDRAK